MKWATWTICYLSQQWYASLLSWNCEYYELQGSMSSSRRPMLSRIGARPNWGPRPRIAGQLQPDNVEVELAPKLPIGRGSGK